MSSAPISAGGEPTTLASLELDLDVFSGPFDLLLTLVLRQEVDLLELSLADVVLGYLDHLEQRGELDLETATEFIVLVAALLELKSRLMLTGEEEELLDIEPQQAAEELLARMLDARRFRAAAEHLRELLAAEHGVRFRLAPVPASLRRSILQPPEGSEDPQRLGEAIGRLLLMPPEINVLHIAVPRITVSERLAHLRALLRRGSFTLEEAVGNADRMTVAVTLFALLELYKLGEADWEQQESFGEVSIHAASRHDAASPPAFDAPVSAARVGAQRGGGERSPGERSGDERSGGEGVAGDRRAADRVGAAQ
jgi:segregation and condensation protein A